MSSSTEAVSQTAAAAPKSGRLRLDFLDGIRALAALYVLVAHAICFSTGVHIRSGLAGLATNWLMYGHIAVDVFIVLSGFCLMLPWVLKPENRLDPADFFRRRARRILPPLYAALLVCLAMKVAGARLGLVANNIDAKALLCNFLLLQDVLPETNVVNAVFWSVALEFKIYLFFPLLLTVYRRYGTPAAVLLAGGLGYGLTGLYRALRPDMPMHHTCPWFLLLFAMGMSGAVLVFSRRAVTLTSRRQGALIGISALFFLAMVGLLRLFPAVDTTGELPFFAPGTPLIDPVVGIATTALLILLGLRHRAGLRSPIDSALSWRPLVWVGTISYSVYLIHLPFVHLISDFQTHFLASRFAALAVDAPLGAALYFAMALPIAVGISYVFFLLFERPFLSAPAKKRAAAHLNSTDSTSAAATGTTVSG